MLRPVHSALTLLGLFLGLPLVGGAGCGGGTTAAMILVGAEDGLMLDQVQVVAVGRAADGTTVPPEVRTYGVTSGPGAWPQTVAIIAGREASAGVDVTVLGLRAGVEVARGGAAVDFVADTTVEAKVGLWASCRGVVCEGRSFCAADGQCSPAARRLDFAVNAAAAGDQTSAAVTGLAERGWVVAWIDGSASPPQVVMRRFDRDGLPLDPTDVVVDPGAREQRDPALASPPDGEAFVAAWSEGPEGGIRVRRFKPGGAALGAAESPGGTPTAEQIAPAVGASPASFLVAWQDAQAATGAGWSVRFRRGRWDLGWLDTAAGYAATAPTAAEFAPAACGGCGGVESFLVAWQDASGADPDFSGTQIRGRWVTGLPASGGESVINLSIAGDQITPAAASSGEASAIVWDDLGDPSVAGSVPAIRLRLCRPDASVAPLSGEIVLAGAGAREARPAVGVAGDVALVVWEIEDPDQPGRTVLRGSRFHMSGTSVDREPFAIAPPRLGSQARARVAGGLKAFAIVWQEQDGAGAAGWEIRARVLGVADEP